MPTDFHHGLLSLPCLLLRGVTECQERLGENIVVCHHDPTSSMVSWERRWIHSAGRPNWTVLPSDVTVERCRPVV